MDASTSDGASMVGASLFKKKGLDGGGVSVYLEGGGEACGGGRDDGRGAGGGVATIVQVVAAGIQYNKSCCITVL